MTHLTTHLIHRALSLLLPPPINAVQHARRELARERERMNRQQARADLAQGYASLHREHVKQLERWLREHGQQPVAGDMPPAYPSKA